MTTYTPTQARELAFIHDDIRSNGLSDTGQLLRSLADKVDELTAELEQCRVQLAGCGVAAMQNTESSKAERAKQGDYGWSGSYRDVCNAVDREIAYRKQIDVLIAEVVMLKLQLNMGI